MKDATSPAERSAALPDPTETRAFVRRCLVLMAVGVGISMISAIYDLEDGVGQYLKSVAETLYIGIPVIAGVIAGVSPRTPMRLLRRALGVALLIMVALDFVPPLETYVQVEELIMRPPAATVEVTTVEALPSWIRSGAIARLAYYFTGGYPEAEQPREVMGDDSDRWKVGTAFYRISFLFLVPVIMGIVLGLSSWVDDRVLFRDARDERIALVVMSWIVAPTTFYMVVGLQDIGVREVFGGDAPFWSLFNVLYILGGIAAVGWWAAGRSRR